MKLSELINFQSNKLRLEEIKNNRSNIVPFVGAGVSKGCGLYTWGELLHKLAIDYLSSDEIDLLESNGDFLKYADRIVNVAGNSDMIMKRIREILAEIETIPNEIPYLLVSMFSKIIITTNYDTLLENASKNSKLGQLKPLLPCLVGQMNETIQLNERSLLKIHGSIEESSSFVFTTDQYRKFYGEKGKRANKLLSLYLTKIFSGKKVLFVGCSLDKDFTLEILEECIQKNRSVSHFAIVPYPSDSQKQLERNRQLTKLGIEPIYYPEGDFLCVKHLINYLAENNHFVSSLEQILAEILGKEQESDYQLRVLLSLLRESFYSTALQFPELLDVDNCKEDFSSDIWGFIGNYRSQNDTLYNICKKAFTAYVQSGYMRCQKEVIKTFFNHFDDLLLKDTEVECLLKKRWSIERNLSKSTALELTWAEKLSNTEIDNYAMDLIEKLQYKNGMNFAEIAPVYTMAKQFFEITKERINFNIKIRLLNSIGAFGHYFSDSKVAETYLQMCIDEIDSCENADRQLMLFKAKCYANLAIAKSFNGTDVFSVLKALEQDISIKKKYNESIQLYSRSLNFYATVLKEVDPFKACEVYLEVADIKENFMNSTKNEEQIKELTASWATTIFNIGLLAKDLELYELAYKIICFANEQRFKTVDHCNRDYCSSINVRAELELFVHEKQKLEWLINGIESRTDLPEGFSGTLAHSWYVCAYYYYLKHEYSVAIKYINKSLAESKKEGALIDFRQDMRTKMLLGDIKSAQNKELANHSNDAEMIYKDIVNGIMEMYGSDSYYLVAPYRRLKQIVESALEKDKYNCAYNILNKKYKLAIKKLGKKLNNYIQQSFNK